MTPHPFRFGAVVGRRGTAASWAAIARDLEQRGLSTLLVPDTVGTASPFSALAAAAAATERLHLGTWVLSAPLRSPEAAVREATTLHELSGGRFELGLGAGRPGGEHDAERLGVEWGAPGRRVDRVEATAAAVRAELPDLPVVIAGNGDRMLRIAGAHARTLALAMPPTATVDEVAALATRARTTAGADLEIALQIAGVGDDLPDWLRNRLGLSARGLEEADAAALLSGDVERDADHLEHLREAAGVSYFTMAHEHAEVLTPLIERLGGA
ncbi:LLM class flavin-dependent oxidoreductase [Agromyces endophyticus]|uniref:LLM class flavin-dependent oxidoreductase n=1 Tax=Agromyces sp. H17E-10 TaxID=2932244 RepID=UPI001FCFA53D|nr:LLM class flavin-dependent oxidoreductase [Agromyces sp. H17E-10]UOQ90654.1 LLM class flavin-dependent oxidoreductase [Agromyces sp. H17E-10]